MEKTKFKSVEEYFSIVPVQVRTILEEMRKTIKEAAPESNEVISYNMPAYKQHGILVYFAAAKNHIGFYPTASPMNAFKDRLVDFKTSKGAIQFPLDKDLPRKLISEIVKFRVEEDRAKAMAKKKK